MIKCKILHAGSAQALQVAIDVFLIESQKSIQIEIVNIKYSVVHSSNVYHYVLIFYK